jgi:hypothetical protein
MRNLGNITAGQTVNFLFATNNDSGQAVAPTTAGTVSIYKNADAAQTTTGVTYTTSFDAVTGINLVTIVTTDAFYVSASDYTVVLTGAVVDGQTVNAVLAEFSIANRYPAPVQNADALLDRTDGIETGVSLRQAVRTVAAVIAGKASGAGTGTEVFVGLDGVTSRVQVNADSSGNRTNVAYS